MSKREMKKALALAIREAGGESELARTLGVSRQAVHQWTVCPKRHVKRIAKAARGAVTTQQLRPDLNIK